MSEEMIRKCKDDIAKFGFTGQEYIQFLISVCAMKDENTVVKLPLNEINEYRDKFVKKNECDVDDSLEFDKCKSKDGNYFCPRIFWDRVLAKYI